MTRRSKNRLAALVALATLGVTASAEASPANWAYLWADQPSAASYTPNLTFQDNSGGGTNTVSRSGVGVYTAMLPGLGAFAGTVHVTAYGTGNRTCKVAGWGPSSSTQQVSVRCFDAAGAPADSAFTLTYANPVTPDGAMAYLWANQGSTASYTPAVPFQFNSSGAVNTMTRTGVGAYTASLPNLGAAAGHVQVTAYGTGSERCKVRSWGPVGTTQQVRVSCSTSAGSPVDTLFTLTYVVETSLVGGSTCCAPDPGPSGTYVWANLAGSPSYTPHLSYQWDDFGGTNTVTRSATGAYSVQFTNHSLSFGDVQVTAYGDGAAHCKVASWTPSAGVQVRCFDSAGQPADAQFDAAFIDHFSGF